jgi:inorganic triphosphatase YgiF
MRSEGEIWNYQELEAKVIICSENPQLVAQDIARLISIADHQLLPQGPETIHDWYFDTLEGALHAQKLALRVREIGANRWITLKGPSQQTDWGGVRRLEIEEPWSQDALTKVIKQLMDRKIKVLKQYNDFDRTDPLDVMTSQGFKVIQDRENYRQVRNVVVKGQEDGPVPAEMVIDSVAYRIRDQKIFHYEVEIEAKLKAGTEVLKTAIANLVEMFAPALRKWNYGKLITGKTIEKLISEGALEGLIDLNNNLKPAAYDKISGYLEKYD